MSVFFGFTMDDCNILLVCGGGGAEHDISLISADFFEDHLKSLEKTQVYRVELNRSGDWTGKDGQSCWLKRGGILVGFGGEVILDFAIPCIHGSPGEDGKIQALFELMGLLYLGSGSDAGLLAFDKVSTKLWAEALGIPTTPFIFLSDPSRESLSRAIAFLEEWETVFVKPSRQGSSMGMSKVSEKGSLEEKIHHAFEYSSAVLIERSIQGRELELALYEYEGVLQVSAPGEILCPGGFYDYRQKYADDTSARTVVEAEGLDSKAIETLKSYSRRIFCGLGCRDLARVDFFMMKGGKIILNEINTFPGHTNISMFPMMMENNGHSYSNFLQDRIAKRRVSS